ncbi:methyltransferase domain-containing protein [Natronobacterium texcoconense]|uniref:Methyltransferase domain-containing protein n=1 Tax=Natronobacterium texcoconense TaxID=1095778 RepID=A0A1H1GW75_NATTX|nr:methyltransferase domain-containing protein [Natronobacterium texcoconense]SDR17411.1 Methyltransferase domain-containing protein [Natronobacterium texcoconense]
MERQSRETVSGETNETPNDGAYERHLERSRTMWNRWSDYYGMSERDFEPMREDLIDRLEIQPGDRVLEVGCGPGVNLERLRNDVGEAGEVVAVDYSPEMVGKARERIEDGGWENVTVRCEDATTATFDEPFDAALASLSLSVMPDARATVENVYGSLDAEAPLGVLDVRPFPEGPGRIVNPFVRRFLQWYANWNPENDVLESLEAVFEESDVVETHLGGFNYVVLCRKETATD